MGRTWLGVSAWGDEIAITLLGLKDRFTGFVTAAKKTRTVKWNLR